MEAAPPAVLLLNGITRRFGRVTALDGATLRVEQGTVHALLGENGAGKTTLMRVAFGLAQPSAGTISVLGQPMHLASPGAALAAGIGMVHQHFTLVPAMTVAENVALGGHGRFSMSDWALRVRAIGERTGLVLDPLARVEDLPVGAQQRCEIVKALARDVKLLILDEPTAMLAPAEARALLLWTRHFAEQGHAVVLITHKLRDALAVADEVTVLRRGKSVLQAAALATSESEVAAVMLGAERGAQGAALGGVNGIAVPGRVLAQSAVARTQDLLPANSAANAQHPESQITVAGSPLGNLALAATGEQRSGSQITNAAELHPNRAHTVADRLHSISPSNDAASQHKRSAGSFNVHGSESDVSTTDHHVESLDAADPKHQGVPTTGVDTSRLLFRPLVANPLHPASPISDVPLLHSASPIGEVLPLHPAPPVGAVVPLHLPSLIAAAGMPQQGSHPAREVVSTSSSATIALDSLHASSPNAKASALHSASSSTAIVRVLNVSVHDSYGVTRMRRVSLSVHRGEIVGVAAIEGSGQRELLRLVSGRLQPTTGEVQLPARVGFVPEDRHNDALLLARSLVENVALRGAGTRRGRMPWQALRLATRQIIAEQQVRAGGENVEARTLSGGNQQKLILGRELADEPEALVVENPTRGLDFRATTAVHDALRAARAKGTAVVVYSSDLDEVLALADRVVVMHAAQLSETALDREVIGRAMLGA